MIRPTLLLGVLAAATLVACGSDREAIGSSESDEPGTTSDQSTSAAKDEEDATTTTASESPDSAQDLTAVAGLTSAVSPVGVRDTSVGAKVTNPNEDLAAYNVTVVFNLLDAAGNTIDTDAVDVPYIPAGSTVPVAPEQIGSNLPTEPTEVTVDMVGDFADDTGWDGADLVTGEGFELELGAATITPGPSGGPQLGFTVTNPSDTVAEFGEWVCIFQQGDEIVGGKTEPIYSPVVPGGTVKVDSALAPDGLTANTIACRAWA